MFSAHIILYIINIYRIYMSSSSHLLLSHHFIETTPDNAYAYRYGKSLSYATALLLNIIRNAHAPHAATI